MLPLQHFLKSLQQLNDSISQPKTQLHERLVQRDVGNTGQKEKLGSNVFTFIGYRRKEKTGEAFCVGGIPHFLPTNVHKCDEFHMPRECRKINRMKEGRRNIHPDLCCILCIHG